MKTLTLIRHAKSSWNDETVADIDRPLNNRGERDAPFIGRFLAKQGLTPDLVISSPALRAITTARIIAKTTGLPAERVVTDDRVYDAYVTDLLEIICEQDESNGHVFLVGHNPGILELAYCLVGPCVDMMPTCGVIVIDLAVTQWASVEQRCGSMRKFIYPKMFR